ncbi:MAG TPA: hydrogen peroxide-inducible genes activator [Thiotrichaceae bacterium]|jgi:LysR family hydrogen peroxide-inducible transcriptional activator|nr:hydrogen peroxide-inducible genes activator [Thiotrichaceae bacterium]HIM08827.1 hydrogen peroxide-inducible genes activator [Gammaproteobacteria bacterium]
MTLSEFRYIVAVAKELHFGRAAEKCFVSQPTLSVAVKKIEYELGVALFERHQHEVSVTPIGESIIKQAELILNETNNLKEIAKQNKDELKGELKLGIIYTIGPYLLPKLIPVINKKASELALIIEEDFTKNLTTKLKSGEIDIAILSNPFEKSGIATEILYKEPFQVALPNGHPLTKKKKLKASDLMNDTMLLLKAGNCFREQIVELCPACINPISENKKIQKTLESSSIETIRQMVAAGVGITILPGLSIDAQTGLKGLLEYRPFSNPVPYREVIIAYRKSFPRKKAIELMKESIANCKLGL